MKTVTDPKILAALDIPAGHKLVRVDYDWAEYLSMPDRYDPALVSETEAQEDSQVRAILGTQYAMALDE